AYGIDLSMLKGKKMLNIDSDEEGVFLTSCAGGTAVKATIPVQRIPQHGIVLKLTVDGLSGGHSGAEIHKEHGNADILMGRFLDNLAKEVPFGMISLAGGLKDNAIPRECTATIMIPMIINEKNLEFAENAKEDNESCKSTNENVNCNIECTGNCSTCSSCDSNNKTAAITVSDTDINKNLFYKKVIELTNQYSEMYKKEFFVSDKNVNVSCEVLGTQYASILDFSSLNRILCYLRMVPNGVIHMSQAISGLVETSLNLGIMELKEHALIVETSIRSSVSTRKEDVKDRVINVIELVGGEAEIIGNYPAWEYKAESKLREEIAVAYKNVYGTEPKFDAIHAGLECGILSEKIENLDCVSFGPKNLDIHTPKERLSISSTERVWNFLIEYLKSAR
ncbi:MAG: M20/M25/M40 family metallo-hydrolase, partial [Lachnospiraceae bacterium]|nr:M20/M25/M40 family metallo-hydrolase [Lachnospiraceae bacterium]